jgi:hypothetical protein
VDRDDVTSAGLTAIGIVAGTLARAVAIGGRLVATGLETLETALRAGEEGSSAAARSGRTAPAGRPAGTWAGASGDDSGEADEDDEDSDGGFARLREPAFEPADGVTPPARPARSAIRRSSAAAAARTAPEPRPAKRATAKSLPPNLRPVDARTTTSEPAPVKGAAGAADLEAVTPARSRAKKTTAPTTTAAKKAAAKKTTAKKAPAKKAAKKS